MTSRGGPRIPMHRGARLLVVASIAVAVSPGSRSIARWCRYLGRGISRCGFGVSRHSIDIAVDRDSRDIVVVGPRPCFGQMPCGSVSSAPDVRRFS